MDLGKTLRRTISIGMLMGLTHLTADAATTITLKHVHGLAFSQDGQQLSIPSHDGLALYRDGHWSKAPGPEHDYMGFSAGRQAIYSSGHPASGSGLVNPLGVIKSTDGGSTWQQLGFQGESDFHLLASGFDNGALYVYNTHPNSKMTSAGLYSSLNDGATWQHASAQGMGSEPSALAVHPTDSKTVAVATSSGLFLSNDAGEHFQPVLQNVQVLSVSFSIDGKSLWFGSFNKVPLLSTLDLKTHEISALGLPPLNQDAVAYMAQSPANAQEWAMATIKRDVYLSQDEGKTWKAIAQAGQTLE
ncbi:F510_1955 family glycosylhydrolase [Pseudomonas sp. H3(2019)]|uniref:F510_1955 family glycosylhydrolase n=1 Tax=Pseudomonas sp. H3(2019) TaxID=2598724 RepID=UPI00118FAA01|nr:glycosyl hydrolase [Pseudomonas sp. H3(2019)]TVT83938.1 glycosyl hydrolase [Pseudomonas sp. H3(2019)]